MPSSGASISTPSSSVSRGRAGSNTVPSSQRSPVLVWSFTESRLAKSRGRELRDSTISMPRSFATARALTTVTDDESIGRSTPATAALAMSELFWPTSGP